MDKLTNMDIHKRYVVYEQNMVLGSEDHLALKKVVFKNAYNGFDSEMDAIRALVEDEKFYEQYLIVVQVYIN